MAEPSYQAVRQTARYALDVRAKLNVDGQEMTVRTVDISEGGIGIISPVEIGGDGGVLIVKLDLPTVQGEFEARVQQKNRNGFRYGFLFLEVSESNRALLQRFQRRWGIFA